MEWSPILANYPRYLRSRIKQGKGVGRGMDYKPWLKVRDVSSRGDSGMISGILIPRTYHLLTSLQKIYFYQIERLPSVVDIREQFPILEINKTFELCSFHRVKHPYKGMNPAPFTIDFVITERIGGELRHRAASIKAAAYASDVEALQRLKVERDWCKAKKIPWSRVDTTKFSKEVHANLRFIRSWYRHRYSPSQAFDSLFADQFLRFYTRNVPLRTLIEETASELHIPAERAVDAFRYNAWKDRIPVSLLAQLSMTNPLVLHDGSKRA